jgi:hypothetical protein
MIYKNCNLRFIALISFVLISAGAQAGTLEKLAASATTIGPGEEVTFTVSMNKRSEQDACGAALVINSDQEYALRLGVNPKDEEQTLRIPFSKPGNYAITLKGKALFRGLNSLLPCDGMKTAVIIVQAEKPVSTSVKSEPVTAKIPTRIAPPIDQSRYLELMSTNPQFKQAIDLFTNQKPEAMGLLTLLSEMGEPYAQLFLGLTYEKEWSKASNLKLACYWIGKSAESGISQARLFFANRALNKSSCFDVEPTLEQADVWVKLAAMSNDVTIRNESKAMEEAILKIRLGIR